MRAIHLKFPVVTREKSNKIEVPSKFQNVWYTPQNTVPFVTGSFPEMKT